MTLTFDLEHLQCAGCAVVKLCTKFELNRTIRGGCFCSLNFDLMTLNMYHVLRYALRYFTQSLNSVKLSVHEI